MCIYKNNYMYVCIKIYFQKSSEVLERFQHLLKFSEMFWDPG